MERPPRAESRKAQSVGRTFLRSGRDDFKAYTTKAEARAEDLRDYTVKAPRETAPIRDEVMDSVPPVERPPRAASRKAQSVGRTFLKSGRDDFKAYTTKAEARAEDFRAYTVKAFKEAAKMFKGSNAAGSQQAQRGAPNSDQYAGSWDRGVVGGWTTQGPGDDNWNGDMGEGTTAWDNHMDYPPSNEHQNLNALAQRFERNPTRAGRMAVSEYSWDSSSASTVSDSDSECSFSIPSRSNARRPSRRL